MQKRIQVDLLSLLGANEHNTSWRINSKATSPVADRQLVTFFCFAKRK